MPFLLAITPAFLLFTTKVCDFAISSLSSPWLHAFPVGYHPSLKVCDLAIDLAISAACHQLAFLLANFCGLICATKFCNFAT
jgi:hypothetical protein